MEEVDNRIIPVGCVLTMAGTGSEMNGGAVITNHQQKLKIGHVFGTTCSPVRHPEPRLTFTLPRYQMVAGIYDIMNHITEQYFSGEDDCTSDYLMEGLMRSLLHSSRIAVKDPENYEARSNLMWIATWALNTFGSPRKGHGLDGSHDRPVGGRLHRRHPRHDPVGGLPALLPVCDALRPASVQEVRSETFWGVRPEGKPMRPSPRKVWPPWRTG